MCGICGLVSLDNPPGAPERIVARMTDTLEHRGPDDRGVFTGGGRVFPFVGLGHTRLSILDLSETGHQPMHDGGEDVWIVYNGEIYNHPLLKKELESVGHIFRSTSDTETILRGYIEWGTGVFARLEGMFGLAIYDGRNDRERLILARDHAGIKPLYYFFDGKTCVFGSELKAVLESGTTGRELDIESLSLYFALGYVPVPRSIYMNIGKLPAGTFMELTAEGVSVTPYWTFPTRGTHHEDDISETALTAELRGLLEEAVNRHLLSDVPVGILLSGGIDSSAIAALVHELGYPSPQTFSVGFSGMGYYDERPYARMIADRYGTKHREINVEPDVVSLLPTLVHHFDEPFADSSAIPTYYISRFCREHVKVILSGTGADDILGGYRRYTIHRLISALELVPSPLRKGVESLTELLPVSRKHKVLEYFLHWKRLLKTSRLDGEDRYASLMYLFNPNEFPRFFSPDIEIPEFKSPLRKHFLEPGRGDYISKILYTDYMTYLPDDLLVKEDRMTMAVGLEGRVPFLDRNLVEFAARLPSRMKLRKYTTKYILKKAVADLLPAEIINRPKHGFAVPIGEWFKGPLRSPIEKMLARKPCGLFNYGYLCGLYDAHVRGRQDHSQQLWAWLFFEYWHERNL